MFDFRPIKRLRGLAMSKVIMIGCDLHDRSMLLKEAVGHGKPRIHRFANSVAGRRKLLAWLEKRAAAEEADRTVFAYEASGQGFGLYDQLTEAGIECHVLAPSQLPKRPYQQRRKTDERDAQLILQEVRSHVLAGNPLPDVWVPDPTTRDDREVVRARLEVADKRCLIQNQIKTLLKRNHVEIPSDVGSGWTRRLLAWLEQLKDRQVPGLRPGGAQVLASLLRQRDALTEEIKQLDKAVEDLATSPRYFESLQRLLEICGVAELTAMVFLTELGDLSRFKNRRQLAAYLGLVPSTYESGTRNDCKGRITRQGPARLRKVLCQAVWCRIRFSKQEKARHERIARQSPKRKKAATVACMRQLGIRMWHRAKPGAPPSRMAQLMTGVTSAPAPQKGTVPFTFTVAPPPDSG
jgi:transposase